MKHERGGKKKTSPGCLPPNNKTDLGKEKVVLCPVPALLHPVRSDRVRGQKSRTARQYRPPSPKTEPTKKKRN